MGADLPSPSRLDRVKQAMLRCFQGKFSPDLCHKPQHKNAKFIHISLQIYANNQYSLIKLETSIQFVLFGGTFYPLKLLHTPLPPPFYVQV